MTEAQALTTDLRFDDIARKIECNKGGKLAKLGDPPINLDNT